MRRVPSCTGKRGGTTASVDGRPWVAPSITTTVVSSLRSEWLPRLLARSTLALTPSMSSLVGMLRAG
eukprot:5536090-Lingulodinium_polyedra.AAC.1